MSFYVAEQFYQKQNKKTQITPTGEEGGKKWYYDFELCDVKEKILCLQNALSPKRLNTVPVLTLDSWCSSWI